jgi:hypothetical protein
MIVYNTNMMRIIIQAKRRGGECLIKESSTKAVEMRQALEKF